MRRFTSIASFISRLFAALARLFRGSRGSADGTTTALGKPANQHEETADYAPRDFSTLPEPILSIDLGAAYTKVSYRPRMQPGVPFNEPSKVLILDPERAPVPSAAALIPSIVICDMVGQWSFGRTAADFPPTACAQVAENWKKNLLDSDNPPESAMMVGSLFFTWLRERLKNLVPDLDHTRVRITLPAFENFGCKARTLKDCMAKAGWHRPLIYAGSEPHANIIGLTSRGRNHVTWPANRTEPFLHYGRMLGEFGLFTLAQTFYTQRTRRRYLKGLVLDVGAYTTDIAPLIIDLEADISQYGDGIEAINPTSLRLGIAAELDGPLFDELLSQYRLDRSRVTFNLFELMKEVLYRGDTYTTATDQGEVVLGTEAHQNLIQRHFDLFAKNLWARVSPFAVTHRPEWIALTGGGSRIARLSAAICQRMEAAGFRVAPVGEGGAGRYDESLHGQESPAWVPWSEAGADLKRLATALGGASVLLDVPSTSPHTRRDWATAEAEDQPEPAPTQVQCSCGGLNPDCSRCSGTGFVPTDA